MLTTVIITAVVVTVAMWLGLMALLRREQRRINFWKTTTTKVVVIKDKDGVYWQQGDEENPFPRPLSKMELFSRGIKTDP